MAELPLDSAHVLDLVWVSVGARSEGLIVLDSEIDTLDRVFAREHSDLVGCRVLEARRGRVEDDELLVLLHELSQVFLKSFLIVNLYLALINSHLCIVYHSF